ncbi:MAG: type I restriction endonuclease subunit R [Thermoguttaceae bacterium]
MPIHTEKTFETAVCELLCENGWTQGNAEDYSADLALFPTVLHSFLKDTQPKEWEKFCSYYPKDANQKFLLRLHRELDLRGPLDVLRNGITDSGIKFQLAFFEPDHALNPETIALFQKNRLTVTRQVHYSTKTPSKSVDLLLAINGLPIATVELKNHFTGQNVNDAIAQYKRDRDPRDLLFQYKKRTLVHFAVDSDEVFLTTKLAENQTTFIPLNRGNKGGAGNPNNPNGYKTEYFWTEILERRSLFEIIGRFLHIQKEEIRTEKKIIKKEKTLFPRYHQIDVVRKLRDDVKKNGTGLSYLIQHSAGSGKSNSIAWLAYRLSTVFDKNDKRIFDSVIVVTDRTVLDQQLQETIYQFEHKQGVVQRIDKDSTQLAAAIASGKNIIITTLQKFPYALDKLSENPGHNYAVIIDEAHSSQGGTASDKMKQALIGKDVTLQEAEELQRKEDEKEKDGDDLIREVIEKRGPQKNISFFAFTATPKPKTLEVFGTKDAEGKPRPFHLYSMRQAIEERFILDVLKNYTTYKTYYGFCKKIEDDPLLNKRKATQAIGHFASIHPTNLAQKTEIMVEHFRQIVRHQIGGRAKAMVVTSSRKHALRYYLEFKEYIEERGYQKIIKPLVAFSGTVFDESYPDGVTESTLNKFGERELPKHFATDEYQVLLVADKYQTGFDQPLLQTMYVDKKLSGIKAVQTLSRLNRVCDGKMDTFVLDFANEREVIQEAFQAYYEETMMDETTDPNHLYDLKNTLATAAVYYQSEVDAFAKIFYAQGRFGAKEQGRLYAFITPSIDRYNQKSEDEQDEFKKVMTTFVRLYSFLSQIMPFQDVELEKLYSFSRYLLPKLPKTDYIGRMKLDHEVALEYYRVQKIAENDIALEIRGESPLDPITEAGIEKDKENKDKLSSIITILNDRFGTEFVAADKLFFDQLEEELYADANLRERAVSNDVDNFKFAVNDIFDSKLLDRMENNQEIFDRIMENNEFGALVRTLITEQLHKRFNSK